MTDPIENLYRNVTLNDVQLASAYFPILVELAKHKHCLTYGELVDKAKQKYPDSTAVQNAIAVSTGRKLEVVRMYTLERKLPDLTCLIINKGLGECGIGFTQSFDPESARLKVFAYEWSDVSTDFEGYIKYTEKAVTPRTRRTRADARSLMATYYKAHKSSLPSSIKQRRELIIELLEEGFSEEKAFQQAKIAT